MAKVKVKISGTKVSLWIRFSFGEKINISEYANIIANGYYGLLKPESVKGTNIYYESFAGTTLKKVLAANLSRNDIVRIVEQILLVLLEVEKFGLSRESVLMDLNHIYIDSSTNEIKMLCSSAAVYGKNQSVSNLIYEILDTYTTKETSNLNFRRRFLDYLDKLEDIDLYRIEDFLVGENKKIVLEVRDIYYTRLYEKLTEKHGEIQQIDAIKKHIGMEKARIVQEKNYEQFENADDELTGFCETEKDDVEGDQDNLARLIRKSNSETIYINKSNFRLGREEGSVDYCISDNKKISRAHADIILRGSQWYIVDLKSKNRTFLNDRALQTSVEEQLHDGDVIKLSNEEFVFLINK